MGLIGPCYGTSQLQPALNEEVRDLHHLNPTGIVLEGTLPAPEEY